MTIPSDLNTLPLPAIFLKFKLLSNFKKPKYEMLIKDFNINRLIIFKKEITLETYFKLNILNSEFTYSLFQF